MPNGCQDKSLADAMDEPRLGSDSRLDTLGIVGQERLVNILDQYLIDIEEGRQVDVQFLLEQNADIAGPLAHYLDGLQLVRELSQASTSHDNPLIPREVTACDRLRPDRPATASQLGPYQLDEIIGRGAMGIVYRAYDARHQRHVALKVLAFGTAVETSRIDRFRREAKTAAGLDHPNVVPVYAVGCEAGVNYHPICCWATTASYG
jgi:hypothetical protein